MGKTPHNYHKPAMSPLDYWIIGGNAPAIHYWPADNRNRQMENSNAPHGSVAPRQPHKQNSAPHAPKAFGKIGISAIIAAAEMLKVGKTEQKPGFDRISVRGDD